MVTFGTALNSFAEEARWGHALSTTGLMARRAVLPNAITCNSLISACEKGCEWPSAIGLLGKMFAISISAYLLSQGLPTAKKKDT